LVTHIRRLAPRLLFSFRGRSEDSEVRLFILPMLLLAAVVFPSREAAAKERAVHLIRNVPAEKVAARVAALFSRQGVEIQVLKNANSLEVKASKQELERIARLIAEMDVRPIEVLLEATVLELPAKHPDLAQPFLRAGALAEIAKTFARSEGEKRALVQLGAAPPLHLLLRFLKTAASVTVLWKQTISSSKGSLARCTSTSLARGCRGRPPRVFAQTSSSRSPRSFMRIWAQAPEPGSADRRRSSDLARPS
jgi:hypothetical protein